MGFIMINMTCEKCGALLEIPDEMIGQDANCPKCNAPLKIPSPNQHDSQSSTNVILQENNPAPGRKNKTYIFGRIFIIISAFIACLILIYCCYNLYTIIQTHNETHANLSHNENETQEILKLQNNLLTERARVIACLTVRYNTEKGRHFLEQPGLSQYIPFNLIENGFPLDDSIKNFAEFFSSDLNTEKGVGDSIRTLEKLRGNIANAKEIFRQTLLGNFKQSKVISHSAKKQQSSPDIVFVNENIVDFFKDSSEASSTINNLINNTLPSYKVEKERLKEFLSPANMQAINNFKSWLHYIQVTLLDSSEKSVQTRTKPVDDRKGSRRQKTDSEYLDELLYECLSEGISVLDNWLINEKIDELGLKLEKRLQDEKQMSAARRILNRETSKKTIQEIFVKTLLALLCMVFADYLRAHFNIADDLHAVKINSVDKGF